MEHLILLHVFLYSSKSESVTVTKLPLFSYSSDTLLFHSQYNTGQSVSHLKTPTFPILFFKGPWATLKKFVAFFKCRSGCLFWNMHIYKGLPHSRTHFVSVDWTLQLIRNEFDCVATWVVLHRFMVTFFNPPVSATTSLLIHFCFMFRSGWYRGTYDATVGFTVCIFNTLIPQNWFIIRQNRDDT